MRTGLLTAILVSAPLVVLVGQQERQLLQPGASVRVSHSYICNKSAAGANSCGVVSSGAPTRATGTLLRLDADTLALTLAGAETLVLPRTSITKLEVSRGRKSRVGAGIGYGALAGSATGALGGLIVCGDCRGLSESSGGGTALFAVGGAVLGVVLGSVVGGIIGASHSGDRWEQVPSNRWRLSAAPRSHGGFALGLSVAF